MSRYTTPSNSGGSHANGNKDRRSTATGMSAPDYITMASGHCRVDTSSLHPQSASRHAAAATLSPHDSISSAPSRGAPSTHVQHSVAGSGYSHSPSRASHGGGGSCAMGRGSHAESHVPQSTIRSITSGVGSSYEASQALAKYNASVAGRSAAGGGTMASRRPSTSGRHALQNVTTPSGQTITVTETNVKGGTRTVVKFSKG